ncbi:MAG: DUF2937 family protein [Desulfobacteraceae bacterium]|nr:DUF2937 family protein [Desulfobacteraceae bacterium]
MKIISHYLRLILFITGVLFGVQIPAFMDAYKNSLQAHLNESSKSLAEFQSDADKYFNGDLTKLINHYKSNKDPVFLEGGESIDSIYKRNLELEKAFLNFNKNFFNSFIHVFVFPLEDIKNEVLKNYSYSVKLNKASILGGIVTGTLLSAFFDIFIFICLKFKQNKLLTFLIY